MSAFAVISGEGKDVERRLNDFLRNIDIRLVKWETAGSYGCFAVVVEYERVKQINDSSKASAVVEKGF